MSPAWQEPADAMASYAHLTMIATLEIATRGTVLGRTTVILVHSAFLDARGVFAEKILIASQISALLAHVLRPIYAKLRFQEPQINVRV